MKGGGRSPTHAFIGRKLTNKIDSIGSMSISSRHTDFLEPETYERENFNLVGKIGS